LFEDRQERQNWEALQFVEEVSAAAADPNPLGLWEGLELGLEDGLGAEVWFELV
jgi:hypothetical protein